MIINRQSLLKKKITNIGGVLLLVNLTAFLLGIFIYNSIKFNVTSDKLLAQGIYLFFFTYPTSIVISFPFIWNKHKSNTKRLKLKPETSIIYILLMNNLLILCLFFTQFLIIITNK